MPKPASLMMFLMLRDNDAHALFNIWRLLQLLRLYNINFHDQNPYDQKFPYKKKIYIYIYIYSHNQCPTTTKKSMSHQNFTTIKNFHTSIHNYQIFSIAMQKNSYMSKIKKIPTSSCPCTNKFSHSQNHNHKNFP